MREGHFTAMACPVHVLSDVPALFEVLHAVFGGGAAVPVAARTPLRLELHVDTALWGSDTPDITADAHRLRIAGCGVAAVANAQGCARATVSPQFAADAVALRAHVVEPLLLFLITAAGRAPLHAAGVVLDGRALLLAGPSGSGKSCLALAAHDSGLAVLSDDCVYVETHPGLRVWGLPRAVHVYAEDAGARSGAIRLHNGKCKRVVPLPAPRQAWAEPGALILLQRGAEVALRPIGPGEAEAALAGLEPGFALRRAAIADAVARVAAIGAWRLTLSADPAEAIALLVRHRAAFGTRMAAC